MNFYVDFEATQPEQEIISIGVYSDKGESFYALVKPQFSTVSKYITDMTGITDEMLKTADSLDIVLKKLYLWCYPQENSLMNWHFYSYGDKDIEFLKNSMCNIKTETSLVVASLVIATMKDYSKTVSKYFHGTTSLIKAFNYLKSLENKQKHNALEDAKMLADVFMKINDQNPLEHNPFVEQAKNNYTFPTGKFYCGGKGKNSKEREFACIQDAIEWIIEHNYKKEQRDIIRRDKMAIKIMKAIKKKETYSGYYWKRIKEA